MKRWMMFSTGGFTVALLVAAPAVAQQVQPRQAADCKNTPAKVEGQVVSVDQKTGKVMVRGNDGHTHEFQASKDTLQTMKPGDRLEATLREAPKC
jgi:hypothetical protein